MAGAIPPWNSVAAHMQIVIAHIQDFTVATQYISNHVVIHILWDCAYLRVINPKSTGNMHVHIGDGG